VYLAVHAPVRVRAEQAGGGIHHLLQVRLDVLVAAGQAQVDDHLPQHLLPGGRAGVVDPEGGGRGVQVLGGHGRAHENEVVVEILPVQQPGADRVEEGLGQFGLLVPGQQQHVILLDLRPGVVGQVVGVELAAQVFHGLAHPLVVEGDPFGGQPAHGVPGRILETRLGLLGVVAKERIVPVEAGQHGAGQGGRQAVGIEGAGRCRGGQGGMGQGVFVHAFHLKRRPDMTGPGCGQTLTHGAL
jgi:hypothetical protein